jgi:hypothetical protein
MADELIIPDEKYYLILKPLGYPILTETDFGISSTDIKELFIKYVLKNIYFKWFPIIEGDQYSVSSSFSIDFPNDYVFGVVDARLFRKGIGGATRSGNPLIDEVNIKLGSSNAYRNMWKTGNDYGYSEVYYIERMRRQAIIDNVKAVKKTIDYKNRKITGYTNIAGELSVSWAQWSPDWDDIPMKFEDDVIKLCQSHLLEYFGELRNQAIQSLPTEINGDAFIAKAESLKEEVLDKWRKFTKVVLLRN